MAMGFARQPRDAAGGRYDLCLPVAQRSGPAKICAMSTLAAESRAALERG